MPYDDLLFGANFRMTLGGITAAKPNVYTYHLT